MSGGNDGERRRGGSPGPVLQCEEARIKLMEFLDGELAPDELPRLEDHLAVCVSCRREEMAYRRLEEVTGQMADEEYPDVDIEVAWETIYRSMERSFGWLLMSVGLIVLLGYGAWQLLNEFFLDPDVSFILKLGVGAAVAGAIVLLISIGREVGTKYRSERYREVQR
jgi:predicted anti-sigma-YlaC factor YlaD